MLRPVKASSLPQRNFIDQEILGGGGRRGHFGLAGMHERATLVGGKLSIRSEAGYGTEIELTIPAFIAYAKPHPARKPITSGGGIE